MSKILLVEDDSLFVKMYQKKFAHEGIELEAAYDGSEGVQKAKEGKPSVIILDLMLPKMSGSEALKQIREDPEIKSTPVLILTNLNTTSDEVNKCVELGVKETFLKTNVTPDQIVEAVKRYAQ